jgi:hypothetical protein
MRELTSVVLEMERQGKRLNGLLRVGRLNTMTWDEFQEMVTIVEKLTSNLTDFNVLHFGPEIPLEEPEKAVASEKRTGRIVTKKISGRLRASDYNRRLLG